MQADGLYRLSEAQAGEILQMRLQRLTGLEQDKIVGEYREVMAEIADLLDILATPARVTTIISEELTQLKTEFGQTKLGARRSVIEHNAQELGTEDLITPTDMVVTLSHTGYIKSQAAERVPRAEPRRPRQAGHGDEGRRLDRPALHRQHARLDPVLLATAAASTGSRYGKCRRVRATRAASPSSTCSRCRPARRSPSCWPLTGEFRTFPEDHFIFMATAMGTVKKTSLKDFSNPRKAGIIAVDLDEGDHLIGAALTDGHHDVMLFSDGGKAVRFDEDDVRPMGRTARGVRGMMLEPDQRLIAMLVAEDESQSVLTATENGYGKRTSIIEYTRHGRGTKGMIAIQQSERNGRSSPPRWCARKTRSC